MKTGVLILYISLLIISQLSNLNGLEIKSFSPVPLIEKNDEITVLDSLPPDFPVLTVDTIKNPAPGNLYIATSPIKGVTGIDTANKYSPYLMVLSNSGTVTEYHEVEIGSADFKLNQNGIRSFAQSTDPNYTLALEVIHYLMDDKGNIIDSVQCGNGYTADFHEFQILPNGHYLVIAWEQIMRDLTELDANASPSANIVGTVFQELDADKNVVFQWRSLNHLPLNEIVKYNLKANTFDQARGNSGYPDVDGNYIFSFPSTNEVMKINHITGDVIWRMGGRHNEFTFINEHEEYAPNYFRWQHNVRRLPNGNLLIFDNGIGKSPQPFSRVVEYELDETNKTAKLVWEFRHNPDILVSFGGAGQRLNNGNTFISWGLVLNGFRKAVTEVTPLNETVFEAAFPIDQINQTISYRSYKFDTSYCQPVSDVQVNEVLKGNTYNFIEGTDTSFVKMKIEDVENQVFTYNELYLKRFSCPPKFCDFVGKAPLIYPVRYEFTYSLIKSIKAKVMIDTKRLPEILDPENTIVYFRSKIDSGKFVEVPTEFNPGTKELIITAYSYGEYIFGVPNEIYIPKRPVLDYPANNSFVDVTKPIKFKWDLIGYARTSDMQVSESVNFSDTIFEFSGQTVTLAEIEYLYKDQTYYWRARSHNEDSSSEWSDVWNFTAKDPFIEINSPNGGELILKDTNQFVIRWNKNTDDTVRVELWRNGEFSSIVVDSFLTTTNAFGWFIDNKVVPDSTYKIKIVSINNPEFFTESDNVFTIGNPVGIEDIFDTGSALLNIYPNPVNDFLKLEFSSNNIGFLRIRLIDVSGETLMNISKMNTNNYEFNSDLSALPPGVYLLECQFNFDTKVVKIIKL